MLPGTGLSGIHSLGLMKRSNIKARPFADKTVAALKPEKKPIVSAIATAYISMFALMGAKAESCATANMTVNTAG